MRRGLALFTALAGFVLACNALTGVGDLGVEDEAGAPLSTSPVVTPPQKTSSSTSSSASSSGGDVHFGDSGVDSSTSSTTSSSSSSSSSSSGASTTSSSASSSGTTTPAPVTLLSDDFEKDLCAGWLVMGNAAVKSLKEAKTAHSGVAACEVCANAPSAGTAPGDFYLEYGIPTVPRAGKVVAQAYVERPATSTSGSPASATITLAASPDASGTSTWSTQISTDYGLVQNELLGGLPVQSGSPVIVGIGVTNAAAGDCIIIDDVTVTLK